MPLKGQSNEYITVRTSHEKTLQKKKKSNKLIF